MNHLDDYRQRYINMHSNNVSSIIDIVRNYTIRSPMNGPEFRLVIKDMTTMMRTESSLIRYYLQHQQQQQPQQRMETAVAEPSPPSPPQLLRRNPVVAPRQEEEELVENFDDLLDDRTTYTSFATATLPRDVVGNRDAVGQALQSVVSQAIQGMLNEIGGGGGGAAAAAAPARNVNISVLGSSILETTYVNIISPMNQACPIGHEDFQDDDDVVMVRQCRHIFKRENFIRWATTRGVANLCCPCCRMFIRATAA
jgi:hypothetical protein